MLGTKITVKTTAPLYTNRAQYVLALRHHKSEKDHDTATKRILLKYNTEKQLLNYIIAELNPVEIHHIILCLIEFTPADWDPVLDMLIHKRAP